MASLLARVLCADRKGEVSKWCAVASGCATLVLYADMWVVEEGARLLTVRNCRTGEVGWYPRNWVQAA